MSSSASILPQTLQSITSIKLGELRKQRKGFESRRNKILEEIQDAKDEQARLRVLLTGWARMHSTSNADTPLEEFEDLEIQHNGGLSVTNIRRFLEQSLYDPSIPPSLLRELEGDLFRNIDRISRKFDYADLYSRLLTEWLQSDASSSSRFMENINMPEEDDSAETAFEVLLDTQKTRLLQLSEKFESVVFSPGEVDVAEIEKLLDGLFSDEHCKRALSRIQDATRSFGKAFVVNPAPFDHTSLRQCINGLLQSDLLSEQKKNTLHDFLQDEVVLTEIADVLNMRFADLEGWEWDAEGGIPVEPRRQLNGKYRVVMDEDILQSIFLHYISMSWAIHFKDQLKILVGDELVWRKSHSLPKEEVSRREYYLGTGSISQGVAKAREDTYEKHFFMCQLPTSFDAKAGDDYENDSDSRQKQPLNVKQLLLRTLGTEVMVQRSLHGEVAIVQSDLQWFATSTSHSTVLAVLGFFGVQPLWISFFRRYLEAPLRMIRLEGSNAEVRIRKRGVPIGHVFQKLFGELIIFAMDLAVRQEAEILLYRLHDDLWLCGEPEKCAKGWKTMQRCAQILGLEFNMSKTGSVCLSEDVTKKDRILAILPEGKVAVGFLELDANTGEWIIDQRQVDAHIQQLQKQLAGCKSVFSWIQTWNSCIGRFFGHTFGQPANCFGRRHVDMILETHRRMQQKLFGHTSAAGNSVTEHLKNLISEHFGVADVPDAFLYFPEELGGLGLRNPFVSLLVIRENLERDPPKKLLEFFDMEKKAYGSQKQQFEALNEIERRHRMKKIWGSRGDIKKRYVICGYDQFPRTSPAPPPLPSPPPHQKKKIN